MKSILLRILALIVLVLAPFVGYYLGEWHGKKEYSGGFVSWESLGTPPDKAIKIIAADGSNVYVQTQTGKVYSCHDTYDGGACEEKATCLGVAPQDLVRVSVEELFPSFPHVFFTGATQLLFII